MTQKTILAVLAHPDDETLGFGGTLAYYADRGVETHLICATRGQHGWFGAPEDFPGTEELGSIRENELANAARILNIKSLQLWYLKWSSSRSRHVSGAFAHKWF